ncbi:MAG: Holliday junction resolvase RuvX [Alphaproteobacteria bacterium]|nr:Holliday junction resolvase RuvX [Alphaproteobacteria bacterium]
MEKNFLGIDYGEKRIGLALAGEKERLARSFKIIHKLKELDDIVGAKNIAAFVVGLPLQPDGTEGDTAASARLFAARLEEKYHLPIYWQDERKTSTAAESYLKETLFMRPDKRKEILDAESARIILDRWLSDHK